MCISCISVGLAAEVSRYRECLLGSDETRCTSREWKRVAHTTQLGRRVKAASRLGFTDRPAEL